MFLTSLLLSAMFDMVFCKNILGKNFHFYEQMKQKPHNRFHPCSGLQLLVIHLFIMVYTILTVP